jgi:hypothetical protein
MRAIFQAVEEVVECDAGIRMSNRPVSVLNRPATQPHLADTAKSLLVNELHRADLIDQ